MTNEVSADSNYKAVPGNIIKDQAAMLPVLSDLLRLRDRSDKTIRRRQGRLFDCTADSAVQPVQRWRIRSRAGEVLFFPREE
jgi:hypothetical protein